MRLRLGFATLVAAIAMLTATLGTPATEAATSQVTIQNFAFQPDPIKIAVGSSITWTNRDSVGHTASASDNSFDTNILNTGQSATITFNTAGTFPYICTVHPFMKGTVEVTGAPAPSPVPTTVPPAADSRFFAQTGFRIDNDTIWDYFTHRGGVPVFGYPTSRTFRFQGFTVQFFQRRIVQLDANGHARLLNLLDAGLLPYANFNGSTFPGVDNNLVASAPSPTDQAAVLAFVQAHAPDSFNGAPVHFYQTFTDTVTAKVAFPNGGNANLLPGIDLEMWGVPTSAPMADPNNSNFIYLRWQRGIMHYDAACHCTQGILLADYLKAILTGQNLPADVASEAQNSPLFKQYDPSQPKWVHNPSLLPDTDLTQAFTPQQ
jgi:plastocyanin